MPNSFFLFTSKVSGVNLRRSETRLRSRLQRDGVLSMVFAYFLPPSARTIVDQMNRNVKMECRNKSAARFCDPDSNRITSRLVTKTGAGALPLSYAARDRIGLNSVFRKFFIEISRKKAPRQPSARRYKVESKEVNLVYH